MITVLDSIKDFFNPATVPGAALYAVFFFGLALLGARLARLILKRRVTRVHDPMAFNFIIQFVQVLVFIMAIIIYAQLVPALRSVGTALLASVSVVSIILGLAAQSTLGNLIAGVALLLYRPFQIGDQIQLNTPKGLLTGTVDALTLGYTILRDSADEQIIVPNSVMMSVVIIRLPLEKPN